MAAYSLVKIETQPISEETRRIAVEELREIPEIVREGIDNLRELLASDETLYFETDDEFLAIFLRPCKYYAKSAYKLMKRIAEFKAKHNDIYGNIIPQTVKEAVFNSDIYTALINRDQKGRRVLICRAGNWDPSIVTSDLMLQMLYLMQIASFLEPETQVRGVVVIVDCRNLGLKQVMGFTPSFANKLLTFIQSVMPLRLKEFHVINNPMIFKIAWNIVKPMLSVKSQKRVFIHNWDLTALHKYIAPSHLPEDFDGRLPKIWYSGRDWYPEIEKHIDFISKYNACGRRMS